MKTRLSIRNLLIGAFAGLLTTPLALALAYLAGLIAIAVKTRELVATLLSGVTVLPLMLLFVLLLPTVVISVVTGLLLGLFSSLIHGWFKAAGVVLGVLVSEICITGILPRVIIPQDNDFMSIVSNYLVSASYGVVIGIIVSWLTAKMIGQNYAPGKAAELPLQ